MPDQPPDYDDPEVEAAWLAEQRALVEKYLDREEIRYKGVANEPDWFVVPYVSIWVVESSSAPGKVGWWVISGDVPPDYLPGDSAVDAREAVREFGSRWLEVSAYMLRGERHPEINIGPPEMRRELGDLLKRRASILEEWASDDDLWRE
jgi:hypothetical protein